MKNKSVSFPASRTFDEFLTQLKKEDSVAISSENTTIETAKSVAVRPIQPADQVKESNREENEEQTTEKIRVTEANRIDEETTVKIASELFSLREDNRLDSPTMGQNTALVEEKGDNSLVADRQGLPTLKPGSPTLSELTTVLSNLPRAEITRKGYNREELQVRISADLSLALRNFSPYLLLTNAASDFHIDDLVNHLVRQFILHHLDPIQQMGKQLARAETSRQLQISESLRSIKST